MTQCSGPHACSQSLGTTDIGGCGRTTVAPEPVRSESIELTIDRDPNRNLFDDTPHCMTTTFNSCTQWGWRVGKPDVAHRPRTAQKHEKWAMSHVQTAARQWPGGNVKTSHCDVKTLHHNVKNHHTMTCHVSSCSHGMFQTKTGRTTKTTNQKHVTPKTHEPHARGRGTPQEPRIARVCSRDQNTFLKGTDLSTCNAGFVDLIWPRAVTRTCMIAFLPFVILGSLRSCWTTIMACDHATDH